jgi:DNA polymerase-3 subunit alpha
MTAEKGAETPLDKYVRFKNDISQWYTEMTKAGLTDTEQKTLEPYFLQSYGVPPSQEQMMMMLMDEDICNFTLAEANAARKIVGKKLMDKIPDLHDKVLEQAKSRALGQYVWQSGIGPQMGYSFSTIHALAYSYVGMQTLYLATHFNPVYWNTSCLVVNSGALDPEKKDSTDYAKVAKAIPFSS